MAYKHKITTSIPFDSDTPNLALDSVIDFITSKFIADTPALSVTKEIAYDAEAYKGFPVFSGEKYGSGLVPVSKIVFLGKHTDSLGLLLFCTQNVTNDGGVYYNLHICITPSFDMMCVTPATYGEDYQSHANACTYIYRILRGWPNRYPETRLVWDVTPGDSGMINMSIVSAGSADYGYAYIINSGNTSYTQFHIGFVRQGESALSMWWKNNNAGLFDIDYQYPLKAGVFSPKKYNVEGAAFNLNSIIADTTGMDYLNDEVAHKIILIGNSSDFNNIPCGLHQFFLGNNATLLKNYLSSFECKQPTLENLAGDNKAKSYELWSGESIPHLTGEQIFLRQLHQPLSLIATTSVYRLALASLTTPRAGTVYTTDTGTYITLLDNCVTYALKLN